MSTTELAARSLPSARVRLAAGDEFTTTVGPVSRTDFVRYAGAGGDFHPLHHDEVFAREAGMPSVFAMGLFHAGVLGVHLARWVGPDHLRTFAIRFTGQVWPGDLLTLTGHVEGVEHGLAHLTLTVSRQTGDVVIKATATADTAQ